MKGRSLRLLITIVIILSPVTALAAGPYRILFVGNSYFEVNDVGVQLAGIAGDKGITVQTEIVFIGGGTIEMHWNQETALKRIEAGGWTHVVFLPFWWMQGTTPERELKYLNLFLPHVKKINATPVIVNPWTWYYGADPLRAKTTGYQDQVNAHDQWIVDQANVATLVPVGQAWQKNFAGPGKVELYHTDNQHATTTGTYLEAATFFVKLTGINPAGSTWLPPQGAYGDYMNAEQRDYLQGIAWATVEPATPSAPSVPTTVGSTDTDSQGGTGSDARPEIASATEISPVPSSGDPSTEGGGGGCFIATAAFGSYLHPHVKVLRMFRDRILLASSPGRSFVEWYYRVSPPIADKIDRHSILGAGVRAVLLPAVGVAWVCLNAGVMPLILMLLLLGTAMAATRMARRKL
jgi:hypothetical protein